MCPRAVSRGHKFAALLGGTFCQAISESKWHPASFKMNTSVWCGCFFFFPVLSITFFFPVLSILCWRITLLSAPAPDAALQAVLLWILVLLVSAMGWAMINPDTHCCFYCPITSAKGSSQEHKQPEARCPAGHLERLSCHRGWTVSLVREHFCQLRFNFMPLQPFLHTSISWTCVWAERHYALWVSPAEAFFSSRSGKNKGSIMLSMEREHSNCVRKNVLTEEVKLLSSAWNSWRDVAKIFRMGDSLLFYHLEGDSEIMVFSLHWESMAPRYYWEHNCANCKS